MTDRRNREHGRNREHEKGVDGPGLAGSGGWGEQLLNAVATQSVRYLFTASEAVAVRVLSRAPQDLLQGRIEGFEMEGRGLLIRREFPVDYLAFRTDPVVIDGAAILRGQLRLQQPTQAIATVMLSESSIEQMFAAALVRQHFQALSWQRPPSPPSAAAGLDRPGLNSPGPDRSGPDRSGLDSPGLDRLDRLDQPGLNGAVSQSLALDPSAWAASRAGAAEGNARSQLDLAPGDRISFDPVKVTLQPHNRVRLQVTAQLSDQVLPLVLTATLKLERRRRIRFHNLQLETDRLPLAQRPRAEKLRNLLATVLNHLIDVERWNLDGVMLRLNQMETQGSQLQFKGYAQINHFPRQG